MIRLVYLLRRREGMSLADFQRYWRETHGPLVASFATAMDVRRYVQVHAVEDPVNDAMAAARGGMEPIYDGVAELWWDSEDALRAALEAPAGQAAAAALLEDEARFIDLPNSPLWLNLELPQVNPPGEALVATPRSSWVKLYFPLRLQAGIGFEAGQRYWRTQHGPIIRSQAEASGIRRYQQVHRIESDLEAMLREARGTRVDAYDGHAEVWFDRGTPRASAEAQRANARAIADESKFIDFARSTMWIGKELVFIDRFGWD
ncbi:MAG TPA: EthD domain-containing protein [Pseudomonadales bacterium]|nr:EthD domain-containing protein [Pseudomonadales bacterium]